MLITNSGVESAFNRAQPTLCNGSDLTDEIDDPDVTPGNLNSECTPTSKGFDVVMKLVLKKNNRDCSDTGSGPAKKKFKFTIKKVLTQRVPMSMRYLK